MVAVKSERKWKYIVLFLFVLEVCMSQCAAVSDTEPGILEWINRRQISPDVYRFINSSSDHDNCDNENSTYLISENQCVKDQELLNGCSHAIVPAQSQRLITIASLDISRLNITYLLVADNTTNNNANFKFNDSERDQLVNSSHCNISSLEVYRGRDEVIEINHDGFSLSNNGTIEINADQLGYNLEEYVGELYYMNLSCSGGGLPKSGCLFFKVLGMSYVTNAKFNYTVPGTLYNYTKFDITTTTVTTVTTPTDSTSDSTNITLNINVKVTSIYNDNTVTFDTPFYVMAGLGGGILILTFCIIIVCICFCLHVRLGRRKRQMLTITADNVYTMEGDEQPWQQNDGERVHVQDNGLPRTTCILSDSTIVSEDTEHVYAVLKQTQLQQPANIAQLNETMSTEQDQQTHLTETIPSNGFQHDTNQTGLKSQSATWSSAQQSTVGSKPRHANLELVQIYDNVIIETEGRTVTDIDNGPSYPKKYRKHSLPPDLDGHQCSNASQNCPISDKKTDESIPIYSQPDMNKKREERRKKREQKEQEEEESMVILQKVSSPSSPPLPQLTESSRRQENEPLIETDSGAVVDEQQQTNTDHLKLGKQFSEQNNNPDDKVPMGKDECLYDEPISLNLVPKKSKNITQRKEKGKDGEEEL